MTQYPPSPPFVLPEGMTEMKAVVPKTGMTVATTLAYPLPTPDQEHALRLFREFLQTTSSMSDETTRLFTLSGAAGTGKTTLLGMMHDEVTHAIVCAPTNKAVAALRKRGFTKATTIDKVVRKKQYVPKPRPMTPEEKAFYEENGMPLLDFIDDGDYEAIDNTESGLVVIVDEGSMTNTDELAHLLRLYNKVVVIGDGFQLPPVEGEAWFQHV